MATEWISRDAVFAASDMNAVLAHYNIEAGRGSSFRICCPFHEDERPSCSVNPGAKVFNCFSCGEQGNVLDFIAAMEELDPKAEFRAVLETAIEIIGHNPTPDRTLTGKGASNVKKKRPKKALKGKPDRSLAEAKPDDDEQVASQRKPKAKRSKVRAVNIDKASLALEPNKVLEGPAFPLKLQGSHPWLDARLEAMGVEASVAQEFGIGFEPRSNALMAGRVCFPIHNAGGELVAYSGRFVPLEGSVADGDGEVLVDAKGKEVERYRLPKGFRKQLELYNLHRVLEERQIGDEGAGIVDRTIVLVEGFWSVLRLHSFNRSVEASGKPVIPVVALMGLTVSAAQIALLRDNGFTRILVLLDGDDEGQEAAHTVVSELAKDFFVRNITLEDGAKPDNMDMSVLKDIAALISDDGILASSSCNPATKAKRDKVDPELRKPESDVAAINITSSATASWGTF